MRLTSGLRLLKPGGIAALRGAIALLGVAFALGAHGASATTSVSTFADHEASAQFRSDARGLHTSVDIVVEESERTTDTGVERHLFASIEIFQTSSHRATAPQIDIAGSVEAEPGALQMKGDLTEASLNLTVPVCGAKMLPSGRLKPGSFSECFDVKVDLRWAGAGELVVADGQSDSTVGACTLHTEATSERRTASAHGSVVAGGVNLAPAATSLAMLSAFSETSTVTCP